MTLERRQTLRDRVCLAAFASVEGETGSTILNLSEAGMGLQTSLPAPLPAGPVPSEVRLSIELPATQSSIEAHGVVAWSDVKGRAGVRFVNLAEGPRRLLREFLALNAAALQGTTVPSDAGVAEAYPQEGGDMQEISDSALQVVVERARALTAAAGAALALLEGDAMVCRAMSGDSVPPVGARLSLGTGISAESVRRRAILRCDDAEQDPGVDRESCRALGIRAIVVLPVMQHGKVVGVLEIVSPIPHAFADYDQPGLQRVIEQILTGRDLPSARANETAPDAAGTEPTAAQEKSELPVGGAESPELLSLRLPDSWIIRNRIMLGAVAGTVLGLIILSISAKLQHTAATGSGAPAPAAIASEPVAAVTRDSAPHPQPPTGFRELESLARGGDAEAEFSLGARYATGEEVAQDYSQAVKWFARSAEQGNVVAQAALGACYWAGRGVPQDYVQSYMWSWLAKLGGDEASKYRVAVLRPRMSGNQISEAQKLAQHWLRQHPERAAQLSPTAQLQP